MEKNHPNKSSALKMDMKLFKRAIFEMKLKGFRTEHVTAAQFAVFLKNSQ